MVEKGVVVPDSQPPEQWSAEAKLAVVAETLAFSEVELSEYCRKKSLFPAQVKAWKDAFLNSQRPAAKPSKAELKAAAKEALRDKKEIHQLKKELQRKEKALAEAAAFEPLLVDSPHATTAVLGSALVTARHSRSGDQTALENSRRHPPLAHERSLQR